MAFRRIVQVREALFETAVWPGSHYWVLAGAAKQPVKPTQAPIAHTDPPTAPLTWAQRLKRVFDIDITLCPLCGGRVHINRRLIAKQSAKQFAARIAAITEPELITKILDHVQNRDPPRQVPRRAPPHSDPNDLFAQR